MRGISGDLSGAAQAEQYDLCLAMARHDANESNLPRYLLWHVTNEIWSVEALSPTGTLSDEPILIVYPDGRVWPYWGDQPDE